MNQKPNTGLEHKTGVPASPKEKIEAVAAALKHREAFGKETSEVIGGLEALEAVETGIETTGEITEGLKEGKKVAPTGGIPAKSAAAAVAVAAKKFAIPSIEIMQKQIALSIKKQIRTLEIEANKISRSRTSGFEPFTLTGIVAKIRELKEILARLTQVTFEILKGWWLKYVGFKNW